MLTPTKPARAFLPSRFGILAVLFLPALLLLTVGCSSEPPGEASVAPDEVRQGDHAMGGRDANAVVMAAPDANLASAEGVDPEPPAAEVAAPDFVEAAPTAAPAMTMESPNSMAVEQLAPSRAPASTMGDAFGEVRLPPHLEDLPAGASHDPESGFATLQVFYATDRAQGSTSLADYRMTGDRNLFLVASMVFFVLLGFSLFQLIRRNGRIATLSMILAGMTGCLTGLVVLMGRANIEKHGVTYTGQRGTLQHGVCEVTVPDTHRRGEVERPSLLRLEFAEDQEKHVVLTQAIELIPEDFHRRLGECIDQTTDRELLLFIHGYNVDFQSAVRRTAQIAVDLPFDGVPICYSWPSQGTLLGYSVDENNVQWTTSHLRQFLMDLVQKTGARSINVVAHSMGNRAMTAAMQQIQLSHPGEKLFDRVVMAAPDVDADYFRRDLAGPLTDLANQVTLYASSDDQALIASKQVHGYPRAGESGDHLVIVPGVETVDVSGIDLSLLGHSYYGDSEFMLRELYDVVQSRLPAWQRESLVGRRLGEKVYWKLVERNASVVLPSRR
ncbi:alpha/beta hydrolase [Crateriforma conspicua]|uniref:Alpha/beta hydrolase family protein n=1 Tax=Crateriforma conspicua TaxID=2527996 RepID=A0A5C5Y935_9PLAN|nr:alpha/beta hydrolase [Crateriforma conspicua]TWT71333.1 hypothetical protein Pan14r_36430 [Crateriforma conspicua]